MRRRRTTRARHGVQHRQSRRRVRSTVRHQPLRRRTPVRRTSRVGGRRRTYTRRPRGLQRYIAAPLKTAVLAGVAALVVVALVILLTGKGSSLFRRVNGGPVAFTAGPAVQILYTTRTANDAAIVLPGPVAGALVRAGQQHRVVEVDAVSYSGDVSRSDIDMTPRAGNSSQAPVLTVAGREITAIQAKVSAIQTRINTPASGAGGRELYVGLTKTHFGLAAVIIVSSGLDLSDPDNFRSLDWSVPAATVVAQVKNAGDLPALHGKVTFVLVPSAGRQPQLNQAQTVYLEDVWRALLMAGGATSVTFLDADTAMAGTAPSAPAVAVTGPPATPVAPVRVSHDKSTCTVSDGFFTFDTADLINPTQTVKDLSPCVKTALAAHATFALDGWTSYEGPLNADGQPAVNEPFNITLSKQRVAAIARVLTHDFHVPWSDITHMAGHGNFHQPNSDPRSAANRVVLITYTAH